MECPNPTVMDNMDLVPIRDSQAKLQGNPALLALRRLECLSQRRAGRVLDWLPLLNKVLRILTRLQVKPVRLNGVALIPTRIIPTIGVVSHSLHLANIYVEICSGYYGQQAAAGQGATDSPMPGQT